MRGVSTVREGVTPRPPTKVSMAWRCLPYELYVMQLYLQKEALERMGIHHFDAWATNFGEVTTALELTVEGSGFRF
ncbi:MAG: helicase, partial [Lachnospiraceae bacterium]|nr:helicase [Lachnospiraceae bacterium]